MTEREIESTAPVRYRTSRFEEELKAFLRAVQGDGGVASLERQGVTSISVEPDRFASALQQAGIRNAVRFFGTLFMNTVLNMASHAYDEANHNRAPDAIRPKTWITTPTAETPNTPFSIFDCVKEWRPAEVRALHETCRDLGLSWAVAYGHAFGPSSAIRVLTGLCGDPQAHGLHPHSNSVVSVTLKRAFQDTLDRYHDFLARPREAFRWPPAP